MKESENFSLSNLMREGLKFQSTVVPRYRKLIGGNMNISYSEIFMYGGSLNLLFKIEVNCGLLHTMCSVTPHHRK